MLQLAEPVTAYTTRLCLLTKFSNDFCHKISKIIIILKILILSVYAFVRLTLT